MIASNKTNTIPITCKGQLYLPVDELAEFQGDLKTMSPESLARCRASILEYGFSFPVFVWGKSIIDGHQRLRVVRELVKEGFTIGKIPVVEIEAKSDKEAAEKLLLLSSRYGEITDMGLEAFIRDHAVDIDAMAQKIQLPEIDFDEFLDGYFREPDFEPEGGEGQPRLDELKKIICPECGHEFEPGKTG